MVTYLSRALQPQLAAGLLSQESHQSQTMKQGRKPWKLPKQKPWKSLALAMVIAIENMAGFL